MWLPADSSCPYGWKCPWSSQVVVNGLWMEFPPGYYGGAKGMKGTTTGLVHGRKNVLKLLKVSL